MSSAFIDAGDLDRLSRERQLTEQAPRALPEEEESPGIVLIKALANMLTERGLT